MPSPSLWSRVRETRLVQALVVYLAGAWVAMQVVALFSSAFDWPRWVMRGAIVLLAAGLVATLVLIWAKGRADARAAAKGEASAPSRSLLAGAVAVALALVGLALFLVFQDRGRSFAPDVAIASAAPGIAILPFSVNDAELERWREGMVDLLSTNLDGAAGLRAIDSRTVLARWREKVPGAQAPDLATALEIARTSGGRYALVGSVVSSGTNMRVLADVYDLKQGDELGQEQVEGAPDSIFSLVDRLSIAVLRRILERHAGDLPRVDLAAATTTSLPALKSFLEAEALTRRSDFERAIPEYERALDADSTFALAAFRLGQALGWVEGIEGARADSLYRLASRHADRIPPRDRDELAAALAYTRGDPDATERARALTRDYPEDPHAWYLLGEAYFHLRHQSLVNREETTETFRHAIALDPTYTPAYIHLMDLALFEADSASMAEILARYDSLAGETGYEERYRLAFDLAFGSPASRRRARTALDTLSVQDAGPILGLLRHPRFLALQAQLGRAVLERSGTPPQDRARYAFNLFARGRIREGAVLLQDAGVPPEPKAQAAVFLLALDAPVPDGFYRDVFAGGYEAGDLRAFGLSLLAIEEGRWNDHEAALRGARSLLEELRAKGDSMAVRAVEDGIQVLRGRAAMVRAQDTEALEILEPAFRRSGIPIVAFWLAELHTEAGRAAEAARYLETFGPDPWTGIRLGALYTELGQREKAIEAYRWVTLAWSEADPELQPELTRARSAIASLSGLRRG